MTLGWNAHLWPAAVCRAHGRRHVVRRNDAPSHVLNCLHSSALGCFRRLWPGPIDRQRKQD